jgi:hypothetical protein
MLNEPVTTQTVDVLNTGGTPAPGSTMEPEAPIQLPDGLTEAMILDQCSRMENEFQQWFKDALDKIEENWRLWENKQAAGIKNPEGPIIPLVFSVCETLKARYMGGMFSQEKLFDLLPDGEEALKPFVCPNPTDPMAPPMTAADVASVMEDFIGESIYDTPDFFQRMDALIGNYLMENVMVARLRWHQYDDPKLQVQQQKDMEGRPTITGQGFQKKTKGCPILEPRSVREMAWDPRARFNAQAARWIRLRTMTPPSDLRAMEAQGTIQNAEAVEKLTAMEGAANASMAEVADPQARQHKRVEGGSLPAGNWESKLVELDEFWSEITWKNTAGEWQTGDFNFWLGNRKSLLRFQAIPPDLKRLRRPFAMAVANQKVDQMLGQGPVDMIKALVKDIANVLMAKRKLIWQTANSPIFYEPISMLDGKRTLLEGMNLVPTLSSKGINRMEPPVQAINILDKHLGMLIQMVREATASNEQMQGIAASGDTTATETRIMAASAGNRMQYGANMFNATFFVQVAEGYIELFEQCGQEGEMVTREAGVDGKPFPITLPMLAMRFKVRPSSALPQANKDRRFQLLNGMLTQFTNIPPQMLINEKGEQMQLNFYDFLVNDVLPLVDVRGAQRLFRKAPPPPMLPMPLGAPGEAPPSGQAAPPPPETGATQKGGMAPPPPPQAIGDQQSTVI